MKDFVQKIAKGLEITLQKKFALLLGILLLLATLTCSAQPLVPVGLADSEPSKAVLVNYDVWYANNAARMVKANDLEFISFFTPMVPPGGDTNFLEKTTIKRLPAKSPEAPLSSIFFFSVVHTYAIRLLPRSKPYLRIHFNSASASAAGNGRLNT